MSGRVLWIYLLIVFSFSACNKHENVSDSLYFDFEQLKPGKLTDAAIKKTWPEAKLLCGKKDYIFYKTGITPHPHFIARENENTFLKVKIPAQFVGPITGAQWTIPLKQKDEYYLQYRIKFEKGFDFVKGGKLPGLAGGTANTGGNIPDGYDGWSARMMFWENGKLSYYLYFPEQSGKFGEKFFLSTNAVDTLKITTDKWHTITQPVKMNTPGVANGIVQAWYDGEEAFLSDSVLFRHNENLKIDQILYNVFLGGDDLSWSSDKEEYIYFDDFKASTNLKPEHAF